MKRFTRRKFQDGEFVITQGTVGRTFFLLAEGKVRILVDGKTVALLDSGAFFGEQALITDQKRAADVVAATQCVATMCLQM